MKTSFFIPISEPYLQACNNQRDLATIFVYFLKNRINISLHIEEAVLLRGISECGIGCVVLSVVLCNIEADQSKVLSMVLNVWY